MQSSCVKEGASILLQIMNLFGLSAWSSVAVCLFLFTSSCDQAGEEPLTTVVEWPELTNLDKIAYRIDGFARTGDTSALRESLPTLLEAGRAVTAATVPDNTAQPQQVDTMLADLVNLIDGLSSEELDSESLSSLVLGLHPVIEKLIEAAGMPHLHGNEGPHDGFLHPVFNADGEQIGTAEIKLHDDAGDLEVWLTRGGHGGEPWRLPVDSTLSLAFPDLEKTVTLAVRDRVDNKDESGAPTISEGATSYFVFPGETGADATWLQGAEFAAKAELRFQDATTGTFALYPHVH